jgi:glucose 1-dehydrogenase
VNRFAGTVCLVTGAGSGIGRATCELFRTQGARVLALDRDEQRGEGLVADLGGEDAAHFISVDVGDSLAVQSASDAAVARWGRVNVLVNCAAEMTFQPVAQLQVEQWDRVLGVNLRAAFLFAKYLLRQMGPGDAIVNVSSVHARQTTPGVAPYAASKAGLEALTRALSAECLDQGIRVNAVAPGGVDTPMLWSNPSVDPDGTFRVRPAKPQQVAGAIAFLASTESSFVNGATLVVDGGQLALL